MVICLSLHVLMHNLSSKSRYPKLCTFLREPPTKIPETWFITSLGEYLQIWFGDLRNIKGETVLKCIPTDQIAKNIQLHFNTL